MKKQLLLFVCLLSISISQSQTFNDGVLEYTVTDVTNSYVSVIKYNNVCPLGDLTIPGTILNLGTTYTVTSIGDYAFRDCIDLFTVYLPNSITSIGNNAFLDCNQLAINLPNSVTSIGDNAFAFCYDLWDFSLPNSIISIGNSAFLLCGNLTSIDIPNTVTSIGDNAFRDCTALTSVTVNWATPLIINATIFTGVDISLIPLTVPVGSASAYGASAVWQDFNSIVLSTDDFTINDMNIELVPNPAKGILNVRLNNYDFEGLTIYNSLGQAILESNNTQVNVSTLTTGIYYVAVTTTKGVITKKLVIQ